MTNYTLADLTEPEDDDDEELLGIFVEVAARKKDEAYPDETDHFSVYCGEGITYENTPPVRWSSLNEFMLAVAHSGSFLSPESVVFQYAE